MISPGKFGLGVFKQFQASIREKLRRRSNAFALIMEESILGHLMHIAKRKGLGTNSRLQRHHSLMVLLRG